MNVKDRPRLGRGLKSLISHPVGVFSPPDSAHAISPSSATPPVPPAAPVAVDGDRYAEVEVALIDANPHQPRAAMDPTALQELAASIKSSGVLQPVILKPVNGRYQLVAGHRRTEAARLAGLARIPALLRHDSTEAQQAEWALIENIQRQDLNPIERAKAYRSYVDTFKVTHAQAAERLGEDRATISNFLRLLDLNAGVQDLVARGLLSAGHAKVLAGVTESSRQDALANRTVAEGLSVRKLEELINAPPADITGQAQETAVSAHTRTLTAKSPHVVELEQELSRKLGTKLRIFPSKKKNTGKIVIQYYSLDEFDRIVEKFQ
jgi:ParB family transcriptional regulator, chromosome partitioning protein